jgi:hypothetical protein
MQQTSEAPLVRFKTPEEEISFLRNEIFRKEEALREKKMDFEPHTVVSNEISRYRDILSKQVLDDTLALAKHDIESLALNLTPEKHDKKIHELIQVLEEKGIKNAMSVLSVMKDPHAEDDFHRYLVQYLKQKPEAKINTSERGFRGLNMTLYEVVLPESATEEEKKKPLKELVSGMEQFFSGLLSVANKRSPEDYIVLEIVNANGSDQFVFYVAVPHLHKSLFERQIISIFHNAKLTEVFDDYNVFNEEGVSLGSSLDLTSPAAYPIKTYEFFDYDPLNIILNGFSKLQKDGEGAAIQIIFSPQGDYFNKTYKYAVEKIEKGTLAKEAVNTSGTASSILMRGIKDFVGISVKNSDQTKEGEEKKVDTEAVEKIKRKLSTTIVATNIRLVASAKSRGEAENIMHSLESSFNQFNDTNSNGLVSNRLEKSKLENFF